MRRRFRRFAPIGLLLIVVSIVSAQPPATSTAATERADAALKKATDDAYADFAKARERALADWLKVYEKALAQAKQAKDEEGIAYLAEAIDRSKRAGRVVIPPPPDAKEFQRNRYAFIEEKLPWHLAKERCDRMGGHLVMLETPEEEDFVVTAFGNQSFWVGATDAAKEGEWVWLNGRPVGSTKFELKIDNYREYEQALEWSSAGRAWNDRTEGNAHGFVCEWER